MYDTILVATDGSEPANRAIEHALDLASRYDANVHVISIVDTSRYNEPALSSTELVIDNLEDYARDLISEATERGETLGIELATEVRHGIPHEEIMAYADDIDSDLTLLGRHGASQTGHHIGSVADRVVAISDRPVQLV